MKDKRIIIIQDPKLRKIRDEFRMLWFAARNSLWEKLNNEMEDLRFDENNHRILISERSPENLKYYRLLQEIQSDLRENFKRSICICYSCGRAHLDMYYNKPYDSWFCLECVGKIRAGHAILQVKKKAGTYFCDPDYFGDTFL